MNVQRRRRVAILQSNYLPWKGYFDLIHESDVFIFYDEVQYTKNDWRNRNRIYSPNGLQWLTIPVPRNSVHGKISEVRIQDPYWQKRHLKAIRYAYQSAPYFSQLAPFLEEIYLQKRWEFLAELNRFAIERIAPWLGIGTRFLNAADFDLRGGRVSRLVDLLTQAGATEYLTGPSAKVYLKGEEHLFTERGIRILYKDYSGYPCYPQRRLPFVHEVSVVDLMARVKQEEIGFYIWGWRDPAHASSAKEFTTGSGCQRL